MRSDCIRCVLLFCMYSLNQLSFAWEPARPQADVEGFRAVVVPFLKQHCVQCHGESHPKADLQLSRVTSDLLTGGGAAAQWQAIEEKLTLGEMPPEGRPRPDAKATQQVLSWIKAELSKAGVAASGAERKLQLPQHGNRVDHDELFRVGSDAVAASPVRLWRHSPQVYAAFTDRLMKNRSKVGQAFSSSSAEGFKDYSAMYVIDEPTIAQLMRNAQAIVEFQFVNSGGMKEFKDLLKALEEKQHADDRKRVALRKEFELVLNRKPTDDELTRFIALMDKNVADAGPEIGVKATLAAVFLLPEALYRMEFGEPVDDEHGRLLIAPRELANAVAFALTDSPPDAQLVAAIEKAYQSPRDADPKSAKPNVSAIKYAVHEQIARIQADPKLTKPRIMRFFDEYFEYPTAAAVFKDLNRGQWRPEILIADTRQLIQQILDEDRDVFRQLLTTNKSFVNYKSDPKAPGGAVPAHIANKPSDKPSDPKKPPKPRQMEYSDFYNLPPDWKWTAKQPIELPKDERAGILTQPSWLAAYATNNETHAIRRGKWIRERLLGGVVPDLPITVDAQLPDAPDKTMRERMQVTRQEYCWQCHQKMNPLGLPFESYDYLGTFRKTEPVVDLLATEKNIDKKGMPLGPVFREVLVDSSGTISGSGDAKLDGDVKSAVEMIHKLADSPRVRQVFVRHVFRYFLGRNETLADGPTLVAADQAYIQSRGSFKTLVSSLLTSDSFLYRKPPSPQPQD